MRFARLSLAAFAAYDGTTTRHQGVSSNLQAVPLIQAEQVTTTSVAAIAADKLSTGPPTMMLMDSIRDWLLVPPADAAEPPSQKDIDLLRQAMGAFYNTENRNLEQAESLLSKAIMAWKEQPADEVAGLYRVRADCYMNLLKPQEAQQDYSKAIQLLEGPGGDAADPNELPSAYLGRARAIRSSPTGGVASTDYQMALRLSSREDWDTKQEQEEDGAARNPYAAWEWGSALRQEGNYQEAARVHALAAQSFTDIGDKAHSVIAEIDAGIDLAAAGDDSYDEAKALLTRAIRKTTSVEGRDVMLLQHVIAKEGEGRIALASIEWSNKERLLAEEQLGEACLRLEQLDADAPSRNNPAGVDEPRLKFSIDDQPGALEVSCSRFKNEKFLAETLQWPVSLRQKVQKLNNLSK